MNTQDEDKNENEKNDGPNDKPDSEFQDKLVDGVNLTGTFWKIADEHVRKSLMFPQPEPISPVEWMTCRIEPVCIVENWFYEDVGVFIAPGGTGKTTLVLFEAIHIALGWDLFGYEVKTPGPIIILTAEDSRELLVARLKAISIELELTDEEIDQVRKYVLISDVSGTTLKLTNIKQSVVEISAAVDRLIHSFRPLAPSVLFIDPAASFGVGEHRVNDAEQALVEVGRRLRRYIGCAVIFIHHTGKQNARQKTSDQYSGRGGSAFADGSRMVHVLQSLNAKEWREATGDELLAGQTGLLYARPKISHAPRQPDIYVKREGYLFTRVNGSQSKQTLFALNADYLWKIISDEVEAGRFPTGRYIEAMNINLSQKEKRELIAWLKDKGRLVDTPMPVGGRGGARSYLRPVQPEE